jgi:hypothetical protein
MKKKNRYRKFTRKEFLRLTTGTFAMGIVGTRLMAWTGAEIPTRSLGRTGLQVTPICFGTSRTQEPALIRMALDRGINFFDTGRQYAGGQNEVMLGETLKGVRSDVVIQSKIRLRLRGNVLDSPNAETLITRQMHQSLEASLQALQTDHIDVMLLHGAPTIELTYHEAVMAFFEDAKSSGKIRAHGYSVHNEEMEITRHATRNPFYDVIMMPYNHRGGFVHSQSGRTSDWDQEQLETYLKSLHQNGVGIIAMKTCSGGPYTFSGAGEPSYRDAVKWVLQKDLIHSANVAMVTYEEIEEDLEALT